MSKNFIDIFHELRTVFSEAQARKLALYLDRRTENPILADEKYPYVTREEIRELDVLATEKYHIPGLVLMENAGAGAGRIVRRLVSHGPVAIFCGRGNNGGDGFVIARHLSNYGIAVQVYVTTGIGSIAPHSDPGVNLQILLAMGITPVEIRERGELAAHAPSLHRAEIIVDALLGTGLKGPVQQPLFGIIEEIDRWQKPVVAVDIPSGLDANTGEILGIALPAFLTITFGLPKKGFICGRGPVTTGEVAVVDISLPRPLWQKFIETKS